MKVATEWAALDLHDPNKVIHFGFDYGPLQLKFRVGDILVVHMPSWKHTLAPRLRRWMPAHYFIYRVVQEPHWSPYTVVQLIEELIPRRKRLPVLQLHARATHIAEHGPPPLQRHAQLQQPAPW